MQSRSHASQTRRYRSVPCLFLLTVVIGGVFAGGCAAPSVSHFVPSGLTLPARADAQAANPSLEASVLVVMTYGFGCDGDGHGNGLRDVAEAIRRRHPNARVITRAWNDIDGITATVLRHRGPVVLVGHSFGGCRSVELAAAAKRPIDALVLLDPVPCDDWGFRKPGKYFQTPANVAKSFCFHRPAGGWPTSYPIVTPGAENHEFRIGHSAFGYNDQVRACITGLCDGASAAPAAAQGDLASAKG
jgi:pimeloyl-ACP methyl ester carboxylesterase